MFAIRKKFALLALTAVLVGVLAPSASARPIPDEHIARIANAGRRAGSSKNMQRWAFEVEEQERGLGVFFDTIIVCSVTGSTQAGMIAGFAVLRDAGGPRRRVIGIDASAKPKETLDQVTRIARHTARLIGLQRDLEEDEIVLDDRYHAGIYGIPDESTIDAMLLTARMEGMILDPVYEGKSMAGLIDLIARDEIDRGSKVLYAHLGGQPALNGYSALFS